VNSVNSTSGGAANLGAGEVIFILGLLFIVALVVLGFFGLIYLVVRAVTSRAQQVPSTLPPEVVVQNQQQRDHDQLRLLAIFHLVIAGLALIGIGFLFVHYAIMHAVFSNPEMWKSQKQTPPPQAFLDLFVWLYVFVGIILIAATALNVLSGFFLWQKRHRLFSLIVAALDCLQIPFGTALGVFTIIVLSRESVQQLYSLAETNYPAPA